MKIQLVTKSLVLLAAFASLSSAGTYDNYYSVGTDNQKVLKQNDNTFMQGDFKKIIRFNMLHFSSDAMDEDAEKNYKTIVEEIKKYQDKTDPIKVTIIGYTNEPTDDSNEKTIDSDTYANHIENWFRYSEDSNSTKKRSREYAQQIQEKFLDDGIDEKNLVVEYRGGLDPAFTDESSESRDLSNRVMVAIYILAPKDKDSDNDGVFDSYDKCKNTPEGFSVDKNGCPLDTDLDGIADYKDKCVDTPKGIPVDNVGCPIDSDQDGIADYKDSCAQTPLGVTVDPLGCPIKQTMSLRFQTSSAKILIESKQVIDSFARFLKENEAYKLEIIGHTDSIGNASENMVLSQKRAEAVKAALISQGIDPSRIKTRGRGELDPVQSNRTKEGREANRRIEIQLSY